jgi:hypothetical protein
MLKITPITVFRQGKSAVTVGGKTVSTKTRSKPMTDTKI